MFWVGRRETIGHGVYTTIRPGDIFSKNPLTPYLESDTNIWGIRPRMPQRDYSSNISISPPARRQAVCPLDLVCKQTYQECMWHMFHKTMFFFYSPRSIHSLLRSTPLHHLEALRCISLRIEFYGQPKCLEYIPWVQKNYDSWARVFRKLAVYAPNIKYMMLTVKVHGAPLVFDFDEPWVKSVLEASAMPKLTNCIVRILTHPISPEWHPLSNVLARKILGYCDSCAIINPDNIQETYESWCATSHLPAIFRDNHAPDVSRLLARIGLHPPPPPDEE